MNLLLIVVFSLPTFIFSNNNKIWNYRLARDPFSSQYYIFSHTMFPNIQLLLAYYKHTPINADINTLLLHPIARQQKITPQQKFEEDEEIYGDVDQCKYVFGVIL